VRKYPLASGPSPSSANGIAEMNILGQLLYFGIAVVVLAAVVGLIVAAIKWLQDALVRSLAPAAPTAQPSRPPSGEGASQEDTAWTEPAQVEPKHAPTADEEKAMEVRVGMLRDSSLGQRLIIEFQGGPRPSMLRSLVYVVSAISREEGRQSSVRRRSTDPLMLEPFQSVQARNVVPKLPESWTVLSFVDIDTLFPARRGDQTYTFTCQVFRPGPEVALGLPGPHGSPLATSSVEVQLELAGCGYLDLQDWLVIREDALTFFAKILSNCVVATERKWGQLDDWIAQQMLLGATAALQAHATKRLQECLADLRSTPSKSSNRSAVLGREASLDLQRELMAVARQLVDEEPLDAVSRKTYESLRGTCWAALAAWTDAGKEPLPPRAASSTSHFEARASLQPVMPDPPPSSSSPPTVPAPPSRTTQPPWTPRPVAALPVVIDHEKVRQMHTLVEMARIGATLGFTTTTYEQDRILGKFKRRLVNYIRDDLTREHVDSDLDAYLHDDPPDAIGQLSHFKRLLDAAIAPVGIYARTCLGDAMRELVLARVEPSVLGVGLYEHGVENHGWTPLPVRRSKPPPQPASIAKPRPVPRPKAPAKPAPVPRGRRLGVPVRALRPYSPVVAPGEPRPIKPKPIPAKPKPKPIPAKPKPKAVPAKPIPRTVPVKPKPKPVPAKPIPRAVPVKPRRIAAPRVLKPIRQRPPRPASLGHARKTPQAMSLQELRVAVGMPTGLDQSSQRRFLKTKFDQLNNRMSSVGSSQERRDISHELMCLGQLRHLLR
jgi:hypothetical protein